jgi:hypothetical protein
VTDGEGNPVPLKTRIATGFVALLEAKLAPGKEIELGEVTLEPRTPTQSAHEGQWNLFTKGKFSVWYDRLEDAANDKSLSKLATGKLELDVKDLPQRQEKDKEGFTAWGNEVGGLQAGLGFRPGEKRAYSHGETVTLVVRVRNVGKEQVKFSYLQPFIEHAPTVTDSDNIAVPQPSVMYEIGAREAGVVELAPGKTIEIHELKRELKPASENSSKQRGADGHPYALYGTGKVGVQYNRVLGAPEMGRPGWKLDPALSKLATGLLELEITKARE